MGALARIMPNMGGDCLNSRLLYYRTVESVIMYGAPIWFPGLDIAKNQGSVKAVQRVALERVTKAYRTTSRDALCVNAGCLPWEYDAQIRYM